MQIKIEIDVKPEELRRFLGLPDVAGLQEDVINFLREKVSDANENFDPAAFVKGNLSTPCARTRRGSASCTALAKKMRRKHPKAKHHASRESGAAVASQATAVRPPIQRVLAAD